LKSSGNFGNLSGKDDFLRDEVLFGRYLNKKYFYSAKKAKAAVNLL